MNWISSLGLGNCQPISGPVGVTYGVASFAKTYLKICMETDKTLTPLGGVGVATRDEIRFNGQPMSDVITYDEHSGEVHYYERHWSSQELIPDGDDPTGYRTGRAKGQVEVTHRHAEPAADYPGYSGGDTIGDTSQPWYPYGCPGFSESAILVSFDFVGPASALCLTGPGSLTSMPVTLQLVNQLTVDGVNLGDKWTPIHASETGGRLKLAFAKVTFDGSNHSVVHHCHLPKLGLRGKAYEVPGHPHVYKIVTIPAANFSCPNYNVSSGSILDPKTWALGTHIDIMPLIGHTTVCQDTLRVMQKLC